MPNLRSYRDAVSSREFSELIQVGVPAVTYAFTGVGSAAGLVLDAPTMLPFFDLNPANPYYVRATYRELINTAYPAPARFALAFGQTTDKNGVRFDGAFDQPVRSTIRIGEAVRVLTLQKSVGEYTEGRFVLKTGNIAVAGTNGNTVPLDVDGRADKDRESTISVGEDEADPFSLYARIEDETATQDVTFDPATGTTTTRVRRQLAARYDTRLTVGRRVLVDGETYAIAQLDYVGRRKYVVIDIVREVETV